MKNLILLTLMKIIIQVVIIVKKIDYFILIY